MTNDELRKACELAGLRVYFYSDDGRWYAASGEHTWHDDDPALPAYVASLLVAKVKGDASCRSAFKKKLWYSDDEDYQGMLFATDEQRIRAAVAALEEGE